MGKNLFIKVNSHTQDVFLINQDIKSEIEFSDEWESLASTVLGFKLYETIENDFDYENIDNKREIASVEGRFYDIAYALNNNINLYDVFDEPDEDSASLIKYLLDEDGDIKEEFLSIGLNIYYLEKLEVQDEYKSQGYAKFILNNLPGILMYLQKLSVSLIVVQAQPFNRTEKGITMVRDDTNAMNRLIKLYESAGFTRIENSNYLYYINE